MKNRTKQVTIYDIAKSVQVSPATVSRALKDHYSISQETTQNVKRAAKEMGYFPNSPASSLRSKKTNTIGVMVSRINRPFMSTFISGVEAVANEKGCHVFISQSEDKAEKEIENAHAMFSARVDGLIVSLAMDSRSYKHFDVFRNNDIPMVFADRVPLDLEVNKIMIDNFQAAYNATEHLILQGCKRIAHFSGAAHRNIYKQRKKGYLAALKNHGLLADDTLITNSNLGANEGWEMTKKLLNLASPPDAIFSANDTAAVSAIRYAKSMGISVPEKLAVVGFNDDPLASIISPSLTTIAHPAFEIGRMAAAQLFEQKENSALVSSKTTVVKTQLVIRESSMRQG